MEQTAKATGDRTVCSYNVDNQLVRAEKFTVTGGVSPVLIAEYRYNALDRRITKAVVNQAGTTTIIRYIYDNEDILLELDGTNTILARYTHGPGIDEPLVMLRGAQSFFYHADGLGSVWDLTDSTGIPVHSYTYDSFGQLLAQTGTVANPYTYTAREFDPETGLYYYRARHYDPGIGRFLQEDPTGVAGGDVNFYTYVTNNPLTLVDPWGLRPITKRPISTTGPSKLVPPCSLGVTKLDPSCPPKHPILIVFQAVAAAAIIETGAEVARGGALLIGAGGPAGVLVGVPVTLLGLGIVAVGIDAIPGIDLGILPRCI
ncbi:MAG: RHS repeat-associated core domain-containing protein [Dehalococcoidia bacterium]